MGKQGSHCGGHTALGQAERVHCTHTYAREYTQDIPRASLANMHEREEDTASFKAKATVQLVQVLVREMTKTAPPLFSLDALSSYLSLLPSSLQLLNLRHHCKRFIHLSFSPCPKQDAKVSASHDYIQL